MKKLKLVFVSTALVLCVGLSGCSSTNKLSGKVETTEEEEEETKKSKKDKDTDVTDAEEEETEKDKEETAVAATESAEISVKDVAKKVEESMGDETDVQMRMLLEANMEIKAQDENSSLNMPLNIKIDSDITKIGQVLHQKGTATVDALVTTTTEDMEQYGLFGDDTIKTYNKDAETGEWTVTEEESSGEASIENNFASTLDMFDEITDVKDTGATYVFTGTVKYSDLGAPADIVEVGNMEMTVDYTVDKETWRVIRVICNIPETAIGKEDESGTYKINKFTLEFDYTWPPEGPDEIPDEVIESAEGNISDTPSEEETEAEETDGDYTGYTEEYTGEKISEANEYYDGSRAAKGTTDGQKQAMEEALGHLQYSHYSKAYLAEMLDFDRENGDLSCSDEDIAWAVENCGADWEYEALASALDHAVMLGNSKEEELDFLMYEGFTKEEATYAVTVGDIDWNEAAVNCLNDYIKYYEGDHTESDCTAYLRDKKFTESEIDYALSKVKN